MATTGSPNGQQHLLDDMSSDAPRTTYSIVPSFFLQDDPATDPITFEYTEQNFGLINRSYPTDEGFDPDKSTTQWQRFARYVSTLNDQSSPGVEYKVVFVGRHGEAVHNAAEAYYGREDWEEYWSKQPGNGTSNWTDAHLTPHGVKQARAVHSFWLGQLDPEKEHMPPPESFYVSPHARCLETAGLIFEEFPVTDGDSIKLTQVSRRPNASRASFRPMIKELLRETIGIHTCDRRSSRTWIHEHFLAYDIESSFTELDELWTADFRENDELRNIRVRKLVDDVFGGGDEKRTWISLTCHGGTSRSLLHVFGHRVWRLMPSDVVPVFLKIERR